MNLRQSKNEAGSAIVLMMLTLTALVIVAVGAIGVVAVAKSDGGSGGSIAGETVTVHVNVSEFKVELSPSQVPTGSNVTLDIHNLGSVEHNVAAPDLGVRTTNVLSMAQAKLELGKVNGPVTLICEIPGHKESGMQAVLGIGTSEATSTPTTSPMDWQQMDKMMEAAALKFPAKTKGTGNGEIGRAHV